MNDNIIIQIIRYVFTQKKYFMIPIFIMILLIMPLVFASNNPTGVTYSSSSDQNNFLGGYQIIHNCNGMQKLYNISKFSSVNQSTCDNPVMAFIYNKTGTNSVPLDNATFTTNNDWATWTKQISLMCGQTYYVAIGAYCTSGNYKNWNDGSTSFPINSVDINYTGRTYIQSMTSTNGNGTVNADTANRQNIASIGFISNATPIIPNVTSQLLIEIPFNETTGNTFKDLPTGRIGNANGARIIQGKNNTLARETKDLTSIGLNLSQNISIFDYHANITYILWLKWYGFSNGQYIMTHMIGNVSNPTYEYTHQEIVGFNTYIQLQRAHGVVTDEYYQLPAGNISLNEWHMLTWITSFNGNNKVYLDNALFKEYNTSGQEGLRARTQRIFLGQAFPLNEPTPDPVSTNGTQFNGAIGLTLIYNKSLTPDEVNILWNNGTIYLPLQANYNNLTTNLSVTINNPCNQNFTIDTSCNVNTSIFFNWTQAQSQSTPYYNLSINSQLIISGLTNNFYNLSTCSLSNGTYNTYVTSYDNSNSTITNQCTFNICVSQWTPQYTSCIGNQQTIYYTDTNNCQPSYNLPLTNGSITSCSLNVTNYNINTNTFQFAQKEYMTIIILILFFFTFMTGTKSSGVWKLLISLSGILLIFFSLILFDNFTSGLTRIQYIFYLIFPIILDIIGLILIIFGFLETLQRGE